MHIYNRNKWGRLFDYFYIIFGGSYSCGVSDKRCVTHALACAASDKKSICRNK